MSSGIGQWLVGQFSIFGIHLQNWMALAFAIVVLWLLYLWLRGRFSEPH
jgi:disulfide bond formation protein DsbB